MGPIYTQQFSVALAFFWSVSANARAKRILLLKSRLMFCEPFRADRRGCLRKDRDQGAGSRNAGPRSTRIVRKAKTKAKATAGPSTRPGAPGLAQDDSSFIYQDGIGPAKAVPLLQD
jgi:hypothetical protein